MKFNKVESLPHLAFNEEYCIKQHKNIAQITFCPYYIENSPEITRRDFISKKETLQAYKPQTQANLNNYYGLKFTTNQQITINNVRTLYK